MHMSLCLIKSKVYNKIKLLILMPCKALKTVLDENDADFDML